MSIYKKIPAIMLELEAIAKNKVNVNQKFNYRGVDDFYNALNPLLAKHGIFTVPKVLREKRENKISHSGGQLNYSILEIEYKFFSDDGSFIEVVVIGEGMDSGDKASNKAMAVAHKYALMQVFMVPTQDLIDPDSESHEVANPAISAIPNESKKVVAAKPLTPKVKNNSNATPAVGITMPELVKAGSGKAWSQGMIRDLIKAKYNLKEGDKFSQERAKEVWAIITVDSYAKAMSDAGHPISLPAGHGKPDRAVIDKNTKATQQNLGV